jgi:hypothetical protein
MTMEIYKNWEIGKNDFGYFEATNLNDCGCFYKIF